MDRSQKEQRVEQLTDKFSKAPITILADYRGLNVAEMTELRRKLREADGEFLVAKNRLLRIAVKDTEASAIDELLAGPTALAFGYQDPAAIAKALHGFAEENEALEVKGGLLDGELLDVARIKQLAALPGRDELRAKLLALLATPATQLVRLLSAPAQQLVQVLEAARIRKEEEGGGRQAVEGDEAVSTESVPAETESVPAETESVPAETESASAETESVPAEGGEDEDKHPSKEEN